MKKQNIIIIIFLILIDIILKQIIIKQINYGEIKAITSFFYLTHFKNTGAAFSTFQNKTYFLIVITVITLIVIFNYIKQNKISNLEKIALTIILPGIIGNLIDRITYSSVIDYIGIKLLNFNLPIFNLADMLVVVGSIILIIAIGGEKLENNSK